jgi:hypothetical protein
VLPFLPNASVIPYKLTEFDIHDNVNMFQVTEPADYQCQHGLAYPEPTGAASSQQPLPEGGRAIDSRHGQR